MKTQQLLPLFIGLCSVAIHAQTPIEIPIYVDSSTNYSPNRYTIYAGMSGGNSPSANIVPYIFDTGAPNMFSTLGGFGNTATASFTFAQAPTYNYFNDSVSVSLGDSNGTLLASTASNVNVASIVSITGSDGTTSFTSNNMLGDGTYGDFGAGLYGTNTLATVLTQLPLAAGLQQGYLVNVAGVTSGSGTLTIGLSASAIAAASNSPGAIIMQLSPSGNQIPTTNGLTINGYNKAQVSDASVVLRQDFTSITNTMPIVLDTGGGPNVAIYSTNFGSLTGGGVNLSYNGQTILSYTNSTPYGGSVGVSTDTSGGTRINPGGAAIYENYQVMFILSTNSSVNGEVILVPNTVPEPSVNVLILFGILGSLCFLKRRCFR